MPKETRRRLSEFTTDECWHCGGSGVALDHQAVGRYVRELRGKTGKSLRSVAENMEISAAYLSDLERGNRNWSQGLWDDLMGVL